MIALTAAVLSRADNNLEVRPQKPPFVTDLFHAGVPLWWALIVVGVLLVPALVTVRAAGIVDSDDFRLRTGYIAAPAMIAFGALLLFMSY